MRPLDPKYPGRQVAVDRRKGVLGFHNEYVEKISGCLGYPQNEFAYDIDQISLSCKRMHIVNCRRTHDQLYAPSHVTVSPSVHPPSSLNFDVLEYTT